MVAEKSEGRECDQVHGTIPFLPSVKAQADIASLSPVGFSRNPLMGMKHLGYRNQSHVLLCAIIVLSAYRLTVRGKFHKEEPGAYHDQSFPNRKSSKT